MALPEFACQFQEDGGEARAFATAFVPGHKVCNGLLDVNGPFPCIPSD
jgi:hypothetical protein